jgi:nicotinamide-nucleotide amidase
MYGEIITIGDELISGRTIDIDSCYAARRLTASGLRVTRIVSVGDDYEAVSEALKRAVERSRFVIVTGGLGSTDDDRTAAIVATSLERPLCLDQRLLEKITTHAKVRKVDINPSLEKMAWLPEGYRVLSPDGRACGFSLIEKEVHLYFLPGVPDQMRYLMDEVVVPEILSLYKGIPVMRQRVLKLYGLSEPEIAEAFKEYRGKTGDVEFGFYPHFPENHITITLRGTDDHEVTKGLDRVEKEVRGLVGSYVFATGNRSMEETVGLLLVEKGVTLSVAESCTGGLIGHRLTSVSGSSNYFQGGVVAYSNRSKVDLLQVHQEILERHGAVSDETVREMARGVKDRVKTDFGLAVTGIAGPEGGSREKPVGTVHIGLATGKEILSGKYKFWGDRQKVKLNASMMALDWVRRYLNGDPFLPGV